jgi:phosphatidylinositol-3-phosphatase
MPRIRSLLLPGLVALLAVAAAVPGDLSAAPREPGRATTAPPIGHVFIIVLENKGDEETFGAASPAPYLARTLAGNGVLLEQYYGTTHYSLGNYLAMISGQAGTPETRADCEIFADFVLSGTTPDGQAIGHGCVYPAAVRTLPNQLAQIGKTWRAYMEDMGNNRRRESATCAHPALDAKDPTQAAQAPSAAVPRGDQYAARHNPFVYFHAIIDSPACRANVVNLGRLRQDLKSIERTPNFVFISPNLCNDGHDAPCKNGEPGGLKSADAFLRRWVPLILADGSYLVEFEGATCCGQQPGPNLGPFPQTEKYAKHTTRFQNFGGDRTGAVLLSPFLEPGSVAATPFNHYSLLKTLEDIFGTREYLGYAGEAGLVGFFERGGSDVAVRATAPP